MVSKITKTVNLGHKHTPSLVYKAYIAWLDECESQKSLVIMLRDLTGHEGYSYLNAIVNHSKHKSLISPSFRFNLGDKGKEKKELILPAFRYGNKSYQPRLAYEFLTSEFDRQSDFVIKIGNEINRVVKNPC